VTTGNRRPILTHKRLAFGLVALLVIGLSFGFVLPQLAPYAQVGHQLGRVSPGWVAALFGALGANIGTFTLPWMVALPGLGFLRAVAVTQISTAFTLLAPGGAPAGIAVSYAVLRSSGYTTADVSRAVALTGIWNQLSTFVFPIAGFALLAAAGTRDSAVAVSALIGVALFAGAGLLLFAVLASERLARAAADRAGAAFAHVAALFGRTPRRTDGEAVVAFRRDSLDLLRHRWHLLTAATLANQLTGYLLLQLALLAVGVGTARVGIAESFTAWSVGRLLSSIPITPAGIGYTEVGLTGLLIAFGGPRPEVVAAVLIYRFLSIAPTVAVGGFAALVLTLRRHVARV
jgi:putative heme transporter